MVNLYGGPGSGKSTVAASVFCNLKDEGLSAELVTEYAKDVTWEESFKKLSNQLYIFAKQQNRLWRVGSKVDIIITDSPLLLSLIYGKDTSDTFRKLVKEEVDKYNTIDIFLKRTKKYSPIGRSQTEEEAKDIDIMIKDTLLDNGYVFDLTVGGSLSSTQEIINYIKEKRGN